MPFLSFDAIAVTSDGETLSSILDSYTAALTEAGFDPVMDLPRIGLAWPDGTTQDRCAVMVDVSRRGSRKAAMQAVCSIKARPFSVSKARPF